MFRSALRNACAMRSSPSPPARGPRPRASSAGRSRLCASGARISPLSDARLPRRGRARAPRSDGALVHSLLRDDAAAAAGCSTRFWARSSSTSVPRTCRARSSRLVPAPFRIIEADGDCEITLYRTYGDDEDIDITFNAAEVSARRPDPKPSTPPRSPRPAPPVGIERAGNEWSKFEPERLATDRRPTRPPSPPIAQDPYDEDDFSVTSEDSTVDIEDDEEAALHFIVNVSKGDGSVVARVFVRDGSNRGGSQRCVTSRSPTRRTTTRTYSSASYPGPNYDELDEAVQEEFHRYLEARGVDHVLANYIAELHVHKEQELYTDWISKVRGFVGPK